MKQKLIFSFLITIALLCCYAKKEKRSELLQQQPEDAIILSQVISNTKSNHVEARVLDNELSSDVFHFFLSDLDPKKTFFTQEDVQNLSQFEFLIDEELKASSFDFYQNVLSVLNKRIEKAEHYYQAALENEIDIFKKESLETNFKKLNFSKDDQALKTLWSKKVKHQFLNELLIVEKTKENLNFEEKKQVALKRVQKFFEQKFEDLKLIDHKTRFAQYVNAYLKVHDVQSHYLTPKEKESWDEAYTRSFVGIGARLEIVNGYPKIRETTIGGPTWKTKRIDADDIILKIAEENKEAKDVLGLSLKNVISLLKGQIGTAVVLEIKKANASIETVKIIREKIDFDLAMSFLLQDKNSNKKIGYIRLPRFYAGEEGSAFHVSKEIANLKANKVDGIIFDIRNNQGGSSGETREMISHFIGAGTFMHAEYQDGEIRSWDNDEPILYDDELLVMVNSRSGSGSEHFSGTLQDYGRALIVGSEATFGKGSMQRFFNLDAQVEGEMKKLGDIKLSVARFFTVNGRSPQYSGIAADIILPDNTTYVKSGERIYDYSLSPKNIETPTVVKCENAIENISTLQLQSQKRVEKNLRFILADEKAKTIKAKQTQTIIPLHFDDFKKQIKEKQLADEKYKAIFDHIEGFEVNFNPQQDSISRLKNEKWMKKIKQDPYIYECFQIMQDILG